MYSLPPIRMSRSFWNIPIYTVHQCTEERCAHNVQYQVTEDNTLTMEVSRSNEFRNGKCNLSGLYTKTGVHLSLYDFANPRGILGPLSDTERVVIPDLEFDVEVSFPLSHAHKIPFKTNQPLTLRQLINAVKIMYEEIYDTEERTAPHYLYVYTRPCEGCRDRTLESVWTVVENPDEEATCSVCYDQYTNEQRAVQLPCEHMFHEVCMKKWLESASGNKKCPLCRSSLQCSRCDGSGEIQHEHFGASVPRFYLFRNDTNGMYGIHTYFLDQLVLKEMVYNRDRKTLYLMMDVVH